MTIVTSVLGDANPSEASICKNIVPGRCLDIVVHDLWLQGGIGIDLVSLSTISGFYNDNLLKHRILKERVHRDHPINFLSMLCGSAGSGDIIRVQPDRWLFGKSWVLASWLSAGVF